MKIAITARNFTGKSNVGYEMLKKAGFEIMDYSDADFGTGSTEAEVIAAVKDADIAIAGLEPFSKKVIDNCPNLKLISRRGIGYDAVDVNACKNAGITVLRTAGKVEGAVAEHVMAYILYMARRIDLQNESMHKGEWNRIMMPGAKNRVLGLVGFGGIGKEIAKRADAFGMKVYYYCRHPKTEWEEKYHAKYVPLDTLIKESDYISLNVPLTKETKGMFHKDMIMRMKKGSVLINIARGPVADEAALKEALETGHLSGVCLDVYDKEPCTDSPLVGCKGAVLTPHTAPFTSENFEDMNETAAQNVLDYIQGNINSEMLVKA